MTSFNETGRGIPALSPFGKTTSNTSSNFLITAVPVRKVMYTTNAIESVNASFRKVMKKGSFPNEDAVFKIFYLRILEFYKKWDSHHLTNWAIIQNQLLIDERLVL